MGRMAARVWLAGEDEAGDVARLMAAFRDHMGSATPADDGVRETVERLVRDPATEFLLGAADENGGPAGVCQLRYRLTVWTGAYDCWLEDLFVEAGARRAGLGRALVAAAVERAVARGCKRIDLDVNEDNLNALALYRDMGFSTEPKGEARTLYAMRRL
jgi:ribosomal protein S18 acetylase RimI-like enzyme